MWVDSSDKVSLKHVKLVAGTGAKGAAGTDGVKGADGAAATAAQDGQAANSGPTGRSQLGGVWASASTCASLGGAGGTAYSFGCRRPWKARSTRRAEWRRSGTAVGGNGGSRLQPGDNGTSGNAGAAASSAGILPLPASRLPTGITAPATVTPPRAAVAAARALEAARAVASRLRRSWRHGRLRRQAGYGRRRRRRQCGAAVVVQHGDAR